MIVNCQICNKIIWIRYYETPNKKILCPTCYTEFNKQLMEKRLLKEKDEKELQEIYVESKVRMIIKKGFSGLIYNFYEKKYLKNPNQDDLDKLYVLLTKKYDMIIEKHCFEDIIQQVYSTYKEEKTLEEFENDLMPKKKFIYLGETILEKTYYCDKCKTAINKAANEYSIKHFSKPLCLKCQGTKQQKNLFFALKKRGIICEYEAFDGFKHIDIIIPDAKLYLEIDGSQHDTNYEQLLADLKRDEYSLKDGFITKHFSNKIINDRLDEVADAIFEVVKNRCRR